MKSTISFRVPSNWQYKVEHFKALSDLNVQHFANCVEGFAVMWNGKWTAYEEVRQNLIKQGKVSLPVLTWTSK